MSHRTSSFEAGAGSGGGRREEHDQGIGTGLARGAKGPLCQSGHRADPTLRSGVPAKISRVSPQSGGYRRHWAPWRTRQSGAALPGPDFRSLLLGFRGRHSGKRLSSSRRRGPLRTGAGPRAILGVAQLPSSGTPSWALCGKPAERSDFPVGLVRLVSPSSRGQWCAAERPAARLSPPPFPLEKNGIFVAVKKNGPFFPWAPAQRTGRKTLGPGTAKPSCPSPSLPVLLWGGPGSPATRFPASLNGACPRMRFVGDVEDT